MNELTTKHKIYCADHAEHGPQVVEFERLVHVEYRKQHKNRQCDDLLNDFELRQRVDCVADAVGGHHHKVFAQCNAPAGQRGDPPSFVAHGAQVTVPSVSHKTVGHDQHQNGKNVSVHG